MIVRPLFPAEKANWPKAGALCIHQEAHSRLAGELALHWKLPPELKNVPLNELVLAASLHDFGYEFESTNPVYNARTGFPAGFREVPADMHEKIWLEGVRKAGVLSLYTALFVYEHVNHLAEKRSKILGVEERKVFKRFMQKSRRERKDMVKALAGHTGLFKLTEKNIHLQQQLIAGWDAISLGLCGANELPLSVEMPGKIFALKSPANRFKRDVQIKPWPFRVEKLHLCLPATLVPRRFKSQSDLKAAWPGLERVLLEVIVTP